MLDIPCNVGEGLGGIHHQQWPRDKQGSHPYGNLGYRWGGGRKPGHGDHLLLPPSTKMEASNALSALCQCSSLETSVVVVRRYTNTPYIP